MHVDWVSWSLHVVVGVLCLETVLRLFNDGRRVEAASLLVVGLLAAAVQTWARPFRRWRQKRAAHWPMTQARVESWNVAPVGGGEDDRRQRHEHPVVEHEARETHEEARRERHVPPKRIKEALQPRKKEEEEEKAAPAPVITPVKPPVVGGVPLSIMARFKKTK